MNVLGVLEKTRRSSLYWKEIMNTLMGLLLLLAAGFRAVRPGAIEVTNDTRNYDVLWETNATEENSAEEKLRELRIEMVKLQILARLNLKEPLPSVQPPSESARETIRLLLGETGEQQRQPQNDPLDRKERLVIHAKSDAIQCLQTSDSNCRLFQYELSTTLNASSMCLWLYKTEDSVSKALSVLVSYSNSEEEKSYDQIVTETRQVGWNKLELPSISLPASWNETFVCSIEIKGENIEYHGDRSPFLMISKPPYVASRQRRDISCDSNESCCLKPLTVSFAEIDFNWVLYPVELQANMCTGKCRMDHSAMRTHYERAMTKILEKDSTLQDTLGECWTLCCKPKQLDAVRVIYNDTDGIIHDQYIPELTVSSCSCS